MIYSNNDKNKKKDRLSISKTHSVICRCVIIVQINVMLPLLCEKLQKRKEKREKKQSAFHIFLLSQKYSTSSFVNHAYIITEQSTSAFKTAKRIELNKKINE